MKCTCGVENVVGARFCNHCGGKLEPAGKSCSREGCGCTGLPPEARYCPDCGSELTVASVSSVVKEQSTGVSFEMVLIKGGEFMMGSPFYEGERSDNEGPEHPVRLSDYYMGRYAVSVAEFRMFIEATGYRTEAETGDGSYIWAGNELKKQSGVSWRCGVSGSARLQTESNHPVMHVSWNDATMYCEWLRRTAGKQYRLPTEAEWEYACRAGTTTPFNTGTNLTTKQANYDGNFPYNGNANGVYRATTVPVDSFSPNALGLYNMHGNVCEWCSDWYGAKYYDECKAKGVVENPQGSSSGSGRVLRGGGWGYAAGDCRSADRCRGTPGHRHSYVGFRLVFVP